MQKAFALEKLLQFKWNQAQLVDCLYQVLSRKFLCNVVTNGRVNIYVNKMTHKMMLVNNRLTALLEFADA